MSERFKAGLIRFWWTWLFAFVAQPVMLGLVAAIQDGSWDWTVNWEQVAIAALAALVYGLKKIKWPDTTW